MYRKPAFVASAPPPLSPVAGKQSPSLNLLYAMTTFIRSEKYRDGTGELLLRINIFDCELDISVILFNAEVESIREVIPSSSITPR